MRNAFFYGKINLQSGLTDFLNSLIHQQDFLLSVKSKPGPDSRKTSSKLIKVLFSMQGKSDAKAESGRKQKSMPPGFEF